MNPTGKTRIKNMKLKTTIVSLLTVSLLAGGLIGCAMHEKHHREHLEAKAKISKEDAQRTALEKVPGGTVKEGELEKEHGHIIWSFDIAQPGTSDIKEVQVDAISGAIVSVTTESAKDEAKEAKKEGKKEKDDDEKEGK
jgi:hypothetical protein